MEDAIWRLQAQSRALQERRADARGVWNDQAARTIEQRFLRPQLDADEELRNQLELQSTESNAAMADFDQAHETGNQASEVAADCANELVESTRATQTAFQYAQHCRDAQARALAEINTTLAAVDSANSACGGATRDPMGPAPLGQTPYSPLSAPAGGSTAGDLASTYPWLASINAGGGPGRDVNCINCAVAVDDALAGDVHRAAPAEKPGRVGPLERRYGGEFRRATRADIEADLQARGPGARGIVLGTRADPTPGHVFNAHNAGGSVHFLDGQGGGAGRFDGGYTDIYWLPTN